MRVPGERARISAAMVVLGWVLGGVVQAEPRCVIVCIGDGMGFEQVQAGGMYLYGSPGTLCFESFDHKGDLTTYSADNAVTDSAAAGTALATGVKVNNGVVSLAYPGDGHELETLLEHFKAHGKRTGLVTTTYMTHATPATFGAHESSRDRYNQIAADYLAQTRPNVLLGGGANGLTVGDAQAAGYVVVTDAASLLGLDTSSVAMVSGQFGLTYLPYEFDGLADLPHLSQMTATALDILEEDPDGFFLMVEGGLIDQACHANDIARATLEVAEFHNAVGEVIAWASGRTDTLILVAADHETGGLTVTSNGAGNYPSATWTTTGHTGTNVPVYAWGVNADLVGGTMDNTYLFAVATCGREASVPTPADGAVGVTVEADLAWTPGAEAVSHDVHFGTEVSPPFLETVPTASFDPGTLLPSTTYYWAVDERDATGAVTPHAAVWSFTTAAAPEAAGAPSPAAGSEDVPINVNLSWSAAAGATVYDVYFGLAEPGPALVSASQTGTTYDPGILPPTRTYQWWVVSRGPGGTTTGPIWTFTTGTEAAPIDTLAAAETVTQSVPTGDFTATHASDGSYEALREVLAAGGKKSVLSHTWSFHVPPGDAVTFFVEAHHGANAENDHFLFAYSTDNATFTPMLTVEKTVDDDRCQSYSLPPSLQGTVYVRATDTDATRGRTALDTVFVDHMFIRTLEAGGACTPASLHVQAIDCGVVRSGAAFKGSVRVSMVDDCGAPVSGVTVTGAFTGTYNETVSAVTGSDGVATLVTSGTAKKPAYTLTVTDAVHATLPYDGSANAETSDSY